MTPRAGEFLKLYNDDLLTQQQIANRVGLSRTRVCAILKKHPDYRPISQTQRLERRNRAIRQAYTTTSKPNKEIIEEFGISDRTFYYVVEGLERPKKPCRISQ